MKNDRNYFAQKRGSTYDKTTKTGGTFLSITEPDFSTPQGLFAYELASINKIQIGDDTIPIDVVTTKVDYSDSGGANDSGTCNLMNATFRALGSQYMTPAQRAYTGNFEYKTKQFILLNHEQVDRLSQHIQFTHFGQADKSHTICRFVTSWATTEEEINELERLL